MGCDVTAEVAPHHLLLTVAEVAGYDPTFKVNPPLRTEARTWQAVRAALVDGTIDAVATDHAPHARHDKEHAFADAAFGMLGLETALGVVLETLLHPGQLDWAGVVRDDVGQPGPDRPVERPGPLHSRSASRPTLTLVDPSARAVVDRRRFGLAVAQQPVARAATCPIRCWPPSGRAG